MPGGALSKHVRDVQYRQHCHLPIHVALFVNRETAMLSYPIWLNTFKEYFLRLKKGNWKSKLLALALFRGGSCRWLIALRPSGESQIQIRIVKEILNCNCALYSPADFLHFIFSYYCFLSGSEHQLSDCESYLLNHRHILANDMATCSSGLRQLHRLNMCNKTQLQLSEQEVIGDMV